MNGVPARFNPIPHLCWTIAILLAVISYLLINVTDGEKVNSYVSFASSLASLILAVVAIFYSIISTQSQAGLLHNVERASDQFATVLSEVTKASQDMQSLSISLDETMSSIPKEISNVATTLNERFDQFTVKEPSAAANGNAGQTDVRSNVSVGIVLYMLAVAFREGKPVDTKIFRENQRYFAGIMFGFCQAIKTFSPCDIKLDIAGSVVSVQSFGNLDYETWLRVDASQLPRGPRAVLDIFKSHFGTDVEATSEDEDETEAE